MSCRLLARQHWRPCQACHPTVISLMKHAHTRLNNDDNRLSPPPVTEAAALDWIECREGYEVRLLAALVACTRPIRP